MALTCPVDLDTIQLVVPIEKPVLTAPVDDVGVRGYASCRCCRSGSRSFKPFEEPCALAQRCNSRFLRCGTGSTFFNDHAAGAS